MGLVYLKFPDPSNSTKLINFCSRGTPKLANFSNMIDRQHKLNIPFLKQWLREKGVIPENLNNQASITQLCKDTNSQVIYLSDKQPHSWAETLRLLQHFNTYDVYPVKLGLNPLMGILYILPQDMPGKFQEVPNTPYRIKHLFLDEL